VLSSVYARLGAGQRLILEYKLFEPAFYHTDVPDWGTAYLHCAGLGERALVCVDTGHHAPGTNIEFIVSVLLRAGKLGAFDFNSRFYADDDLMVGPPIRSVMNVQEAVAKAVLADGAALAKAQAAGDVLGAHGVLMDAFATDVRPLLCDLRSGAGLDPDPMGAYTRSGYAEKIAAARVGGTAAGWG
jgi:L-rhamnose isomerase / sugar isomerase